MKIQNISGFEQAFSFSNVISQRVANNGYLVLPDSPDVYQDVLTYASKGWISIVEGPALTSSVTSVGQPDCVEIVTTANPADAQTVTIGTTVLEFDNNAAVTAGRTSVTIGGSAKASLDALATAALALPAFAGWRKLGSTAHGASGAVLLLAPPSTVDIATLTVAETMGSGTIAKRTATVGDVFSQLVEFRTVATIPADLIFVTPLRNIRHVEVEVRDSSGAVVAWNGVMRFNGGIVTLDNTGLTTISTTNTIFLRATGQL